MVEVKDLEDGSFYEAEILDIFKNSITDSDTDKENKAENDNEDHKNDSDGKTEIIDQTEIIYKVSYERFVCCQLLQVKHIFNDWICFYREGESIVRAINISDIRPKSIHPIDLTKLKIRQTIHFNYNIKKPNAWGKWYDFFITEIDRKKGLHLMGKLVRGEGFEEEEIKIDCKARALTIFNTRKNVLIKERGSDFDIGCKPGNYIYNTEH